MTLPSLERTQKQQPRKKEKELFSLGHERHNECISKEKAVRFKLCSVYLSLYGAALYALLSSPFFVSNVTQIAHANSLKLQILNVKKHFIFFTKTLSCICATP